MGSEVQIWQLVMHASWLVKAVMAMLLAASVASWMIIFSKRKMLPGAQTAADKYEEQFWSGTDLTKLHESISSGHRIANGMEKIFDAGFSEFTRMRQQGRMTPNAMVEGAQRSMRIALTRETEELEHSLNFLATVGSTSPYVGLFGTVWGIMTSFQALDVELDVLGQVLRGDVELRQPEVENLHGTIRGADDVLGFEVAMDDAAIVRGGESVRQILRGGDHRAQWQGTVLQFVTQAAAAHKLRREVQVAVNVFKRVDHGHSRV